MSYYRYRRFGASAPTQKVEDTTIPTRIDQLLTLTDLNDWEKTFLSSIKGGYEKYKSLTKGQYDTFVGVERRHDVAAAAEREAWIAAWNADKKEAWDMMVKYYASTPYFKGVVENPRNADPSYIPPEKLYKKVCDNKYAQRYREISKIPPKFSVGHMVVVKESRWRSRYLLAVVIEVGEVQSWAKGSRQYQVHYVGTEWPLCYVEEKAMHYCRPSMLAKCSPSPDAGAGF